MAEITATTNLTPQEQRARLLKLLAKKEQETKLAPLSFSQERFWLEEQLNPGSINSLSLTVRITGQIDLAALQRSFDEIARRHESLRTTFAVVNGQPRQVIKSAQPVPLPVISLEHLPATAREEAARAAVRTELTRPFDLTRGPLFRATLLRLDTSDHVLILITQHLISDAWSLSILIQELSVIYGAFAAGHPSPLPPLPWQYADFAQWQRDNMQGEVLERELAYWVEQNGGNTFLLDIPTDRPRALARSTQGGRETISLPVTLHEQLKALAQQTGSTLFMVLLTALQILLYRYTRQNQIGVYTVVANRTAHATEKLIGLFLNTLLFRADLTDHLTFSTALEQARRITLDAYDHQTIPFQKLLETLQIQQNTQRLSPFQVLLILQNVPYPEIRLGDLVCRRFAREMDFQSDMELSLSLVEADEGLTGFLEYRTELYDAATIRRLIDHYETLLRAVVADPHQRIATLPLLTNAERQQLLSDWAAPPTPLASPRFVVEWFEAQAAQTPQVTALIFNDQALTYRELNQRANQLAQELRAQGVQPDTLVGLCVERSLDMVVSVLGILKAGGAYVPLDPAYPADRLALILEDAPLTVLIAHRRCLAQLPAQSAQVIILDDFDWDQPAPDQLTSPDLSPHHLAYLIYTSGSTGRPKGIRVTHGSLASYLAAITPFLGLSTTDRVLHFASINFDASTEEIYPALLSGATVVIRPASIVAPGTEFNRLLTQHAITVLSLPVAFWHAWVQALAHTREELPAALRLLLLNAEEPAPDRLAQWQQLGGDRIRWINTYGPTETTVTATLFEIAPEADRDKRWTKLPIGKPLANTTAYVLDTHLQPVPIGIPGELYLGGGGVTAGYWQQPALTAQAFIPDPFSATPGARLYRTGDLVRYLPDGNLEFLGRVDFQVKIRGFRVELGEIETMLLRQPDVREAVVLARAATSGDKQLVAYVAPDPGAALNIGVLRRALQDTLPPHMIPATFVLLPALPVNPNGKLDRAALPEPDFTSERSSYVPPTTPIEEKLVEIWAEVLPVKQIGIHDNFFALGGHSLMATQVIYRINQAYQLDLPLRALFEEPTVAELSALIQHQTQQAAPPAPQPVIPRLEQRAAAELSLAQQRLWFLDRLMPDSTAYHIPQAVRLTGMVNVPAFERSLNEIVRRHESLRTTFTQHGSQPRQIIAPELTLSLPVIDLSHLTPADRETQLQQLLRAEAVRLFDLTRGPLLRVTLIKLGEQEHVLSIVMHHIISDGWSIGVFVREVMTAYTACCAAQPVRLPALPIQYADYAAWQRQWLNGPVRDQQIAYWKQQLGGELPVLQLPTDRPRPPVQTFRGAKLSFMLPAEIAAALHTVRRRADATLFMTLLAAFQTLLYHYTGQTDLIVGSPIANRTRAETENLIGFFINMLALRVDLSGNPTFVELLRRVREVTLGAYAHQDLPFDQLVDELHVPRDLSRAPLFQVLFVLQNAPMPTMTLPGLTMQPLDMDNQAAQFDLTLSMTEMPHGLYGMIEYNTDLYDAATIRRLIGHFQQLLISLGQQPERRLSELEWVTPGEQQQVLIEWNPPATAAPGRCLHELFEEHAAQTPDATAVVFEDRCLTYREVNARADQLARYLRQHGVGPEVIVGVCQSRSPELIISMLGIWKAGGCYLPLDPTLPPARLTFALHDTQAALLLTDARVQDTLSFPATTPRRVCVDRDWPEIAAATAHLARHDDVRHAAYVIYTSGSTGQPKGVVITHQGAENVRQQQMAAWGLAGTDRVLQFASINFDASLAEVIASLCTGATLVMAAREDVLPGPALAQLLRRQRITVATLTPSALAVLPVADYPDLRVLHVAGEACPLELVQRWAARVRFFNLYGPTESTIWATYAECCTDDERVTIGRPIANTQAYILDAALRPVAIGVPGELYLAGANLARGYLHRSDLTAERFVPHPFSAEPGAQLYRTGDLVRYLPDGQIEFLGRIDQQVKLRGFRIELGEIETVLRQQPGIREAVVVVHQAADRTDDKRLIAYLVPDNVSLKLEELRRTLLDRLPDYMVPAAFVTLAALPLTTNGKFDRRALPAPDLAHTSAGAYVAPRTPLEEELAAQWAELLHLERVGIHDNFFAIGGHSLLATQAVTRLTERYHVTLPLQVLFQSPTIAAIAEQIEVLRFAAHNQTAASSADVAREEGEL